MTPSELKDVIDALKLALAYTDERGRPVMNNAIAIMRREREQQEELARLMREHDAGGS